MNKLLQIQQCAMEFGFIFFERLFSLVFILRFHPFSSSFDFSRCIRIDIACKRTQSVWQREYLIIPNEWETSSPEFRFATLFTPYVCDCYFVNFGSHLICRLSIRFDGVVTLNSITSLNIQIHAYFFFDKCQTLYTRMNKLVWEYTCSL